MAQQRNAKRKGRQRTSPRRRSASSSASPRRKISRIIASATKSLKDKLFQCR